MPLPYINNPCFCSLLIDFEPPYVRLNVLFIAFECGLIVCFTEGMLNRNGEDGINCEFGSETKWRWVDVTLTCFLLDVVIGSFYIKPNWLW